MTPNRREFLGGIVAGGLFATTLQAEEPAKLRFGFSLYGMKSLSLNKALTVCREIGYDDVELPVLPGWPGEPKQLNGEGRKEFAKQLRDNRLSLSALMENLPLDGEEKIHQAQLERLKQASELAHALVPDRPPVIETILGGKVDAWDSLKNRFRDRLGNWAKIGEASKTVIAIKPHRMGAMNRPEQVLWLLEQCHSSALKLVYDWSHYEQRDLKLDATVKQLIPQTVFVHIKDTRLNQGKVEFLLPSEGQTDYRELIASLKKHGYRGSVCVEVSGMIHSKKEYDPEQAARFCFEKLGGLFKG
jgi:inosose dehydratase